MYTVHSTAAIFRFFVPTAKEKKNEEVARRAKPKTIIMLYVTLYCVHCTQYTLHSTAAIFRFSSQPQKRKKRGGRPQKNHKLTT